MTGKNTMDRRYFIRSMGLVTGSLVLACDLHTDEKPVGPVGKAGDSFAPNLFVELRPSGELLLTASRSEMGQGVRTSLTSVIADEMDADWSLVQVVQAPGDAAYGDQNTDGSRSIRTIFEPMRKMGAMARSMLITAAADKWNIPESSCRTEKHHVINSDNGEKLFYGDLVTLAAEIPAPQETKLKTPDEFVYIGKGLPSVDVTDFTSGKAKYGMDIKIPGMQYAAIARCPVTFGSVRSFDKSQAMSVQGVQDVREIPRIEKPFGALGGLAVLADNSWSAIKGREVLKVDWDLGENQDYSTQKYMKEITRNVLRAGKLIRNEGDVNRAFAGAEKVVESTYQLPHLAHAPMEVPNATASVTGNTCEVWAPVQAPQVTRQELSDLLEIDLENITVHVTFLGGGFGRKSKPDFVLEAALLSRQTGTPVQVIWTREDDIRHGYYHAISAQYMKGSLDGQGKVTGWLHRTAYPSITSTFMPGVKHGAGFEFQQGMTNLPYAIENMRFENGEAPAHVRIGWLRSVYNIVHGFSVNVFVDELAAAAQKDPLQFRLELLGNDRVYPSDNAYKLETAKLKRVLEIAAKNAKWGRQLPQGHGMGIALHYSFYTYVASVVEVSVLSGKLKVHRIWTAADCGTVVNTDTVRAQLEGAAIFGMSLAYYGEITAEQGRIRQSNYHDYEMLRIHEAPDIDVEIVPSSDLPTGIGEPGVPVIAPAIINAIFAATGNRLKSLPLKAHGLV